MFIIMARHPAWGAADNFYRAFKSQGIDVVLLCFDRDKYGRTVSEDIITFLNKKNIDFWFEEAAKEENRLMIIAPTFLDTLRIQYGKQKTTSFYKNLRNGPAIFITGTKYLRKPEYWNNYMDEHNFKIRFCSPSFIRFNTKKNIPLLHPMQYDDIDKTKGNEIVVSHATGLVDRNAKKGSDIIGRGIQLAKKKVSFEYDYIVGVQLQECLKRKARSHIFIDQIYMPGGGVGKSSLEAIALNCVTLSSVHNLKENFQNDYYKGDYYKKPPVINIANENDVAKILIDLISNKNKLKAESIKVSEWKERINYKNTVRYILKVLEGDKK